MGVKKIRNMREIFLLAKAIILEIIGRQGNISIEYIKKKINKSYLYDLIDNIISIEYFIDIILKYRFQLKINRKTAKLIYKLCKKNQLNLLRMIINSIKKGENIYENENLS